jgi:hypothetical protein
MPKKCLDNGNMTDSARLSDAAGLRIGEKCIGTS